MKREEDFSLSKSWKCLTDTLKEWKKAHDLFKVKWLTHPWFNCPIKNPLSVRLSYTYSFSLFQWNFHEQDSPTFLLACTHHYPPTCCTYT
jgi:hypothetical protein